MQMIGIKIYQSKYQFSDQLEDLSKRDQWGDLWTCQAIKWYE